MVDWGSVPAYFGGLALVLTVTVLLRDRRERIRSQANQIAAWVQRSHNEGEPHRVVVKNASTLPCLDLQVSITAGYRDSRTFLLSKTFGADTDRHVKPRYQHAVGPGETITVFETELDVAVRSLYFTDAAGRRWVRMHTRLARSPRFGLRRRLWRRVSQPVRRRIAQRSAARAAIANSGSGHS